MSHKNVNDSIGYRTKHSMQSQEAWSYAKASGLSSIVCALLCLCFTLFSIYILKISDLIITAIIIAITLLPQIFIEMHLHKKFPL